MTHILAVDDDPAILSLIQRALAKDGFDTTTVSDPQNVLSLSLNTFDVILLDVMMPGIDGLTLCHEIRDRTDCPILFLTAKTMEEDVIAGLNEGADDYLAKPFGIGELRARVQAHLRREHREKAHILSLGEIRFDLSEKRSPLRRSKSRLPAESMRYANFLPATTGRYFLARRFMKRFLAMTQKGRAAR
ncbi:Sensor histidine kinase RcsC [bioreactor metagenome]|uniref:Sensor histidine kinase RcsC n=1 Tax=bioreactor metagenome TaxID=1076179 RepID=A0A645EM44_9ZZZZ